MCCRLYKNYRNINNNRGKQASCYSSLVLQLYFYTRTLSHKSAVILCKREAALSWALGVLLLEIVSFYNLMSLRDSFLPNFNNLKQDQHNNI